MSLANSIGSAPAAIEDVLYVGQRVFFYPEPHKKDSKCFDGVIRGWQRDSYVLLELRQEAQRTLVFREASPCSIRFLKDGQACAIDSYVLTSQVLARRPTVRAAWTDSLRVASLRKFERIDVSIECTVHEEGMPVPGEVRDISLGGLCIHSLCSSPVGAVIECSFHLPDGQEINQVPLIVRNNRRDAQGGAVLGCAFQDANGEDAKAVGFYITTTMLRFRGNGGVLTALAVDDESAELRGLRSSLNQLGCRLEVIGNLMDGLFRARLIAPTFILLRYHWEHFTTVDICRLIRTSRALSTTPIFVYGGPGHQVEQELQAAGATAYLNTLAEPHRALGFLVERVPRLNPDDDTM